jgi:transposase InsO family protein
VLPQVQSVSGMLLENLIMDFIKMPWVRGCNYLLVFFCTFSGWVEAFPTWTEKAWEVARCQLKDIIHWFRIPVSIGSDNGPAFMAKVVQLVAKGLGMTWKLHTPYCQWRSGKVECMNRTLKLQWGKLCQETHLQWDQLLPMALLRITSSPTKQTRLSPFEVLYGCLLPLIKGVWGDLKEIDDLTLRQQIQALRVTLKNQWLGLGETSY